MPEDTMPAILPSWVRGHPTFMSKILIQPK